MSCSIARGVRRCSWCWRPRSGLDPQGRPRETFLITHGAAFGVRDGQFQVVGERGPETWSLERAADVVSRFERERDQHRANSPEPPGAAVAVFSGEDRPDRAEPDPPEAPKLRKGEALPADALAKAAPKAIESAGGDVKLYRTPPTHIRPQTPDRRSEIQLGGPLEFRPRRVPSGDVGSHACLSGSYTYPYETAGITGREVWLCCIPVDEILSESRFSAQAAFFRGPSAAPNTSTSLLQPVASDRLGADIYSGLHSRAAAGARPGYTALD